VESLNAVALEARLAWLAWNQVALLSLLGALLIFLVIINISLRTLSEQQTKLFQEIKISGQSQLNLNYKIGKDASSIQKKVEEVPEKVIERIHSDGALSVGDGALPKPLLPPS
jgi:hypothetical protein